MYSCAQHLSHITHHTVWVCSTTVDASIHSFYSLLPSSNPYMLILNTKDVKKEEEAATIMLRRMKEHLGHRGTSSTSRNHVLPILGSHHPHHCWSILSWQLRRSYSAAIDTSILNCFSNVVTCLVTYSSSRNLKFDPLWNRIQ